MAAKNFEDSYIGMETPGLGNRKNTVRWMPPAEGCVKYNVDGACREESGAAGCGGGIRDSSGN